MTCYASKALKLALMVSVSAGLFAVGLTPLAAVELLYLP
jgi:hypothetical protein